MLSVRIKLRLFREQAAILQGSAETEIVALDMGSCLEGILATEFGDLTQKALEPLSDKRAEASNLKKTACVKTVNFVSIDT